MGPTLSWAEPRAAARRGTWGFLLRVLPPPAPAGTSMPGQASSLGSSCASAGGRRTRSLPPRSGRPPLGPPRPSPGTPISVACFRTWYTESTSGPGRGTADGHAGVSVCVRERGGEGAKRKQEKGKERETNARCRKRRKNTYFQANACICTSPEG